MSRAPRTSSSWDRDELLTALLKQQAKSGAFVPQKISENQASTTFRKVRRFFYTYFRSRGTNALSQLFES
jgi:hypothetical protein